MIIMAFLAVNNNGDELGFIKKPERYKEKGEWVLSEDDINNCYILPVGTIKRATGKDLTWEDEPIEIH